MMSTFSRVSGNPEGDEDDDPTASTTSFQNLPVDTSISQPSDSLTSTVTNGIADESAATTTTTTTTAASNGKIFMYCIHSVSMFSSYVSWSTTKLALPFTPYF